MLISHPALAGMHIGVSHSPVCGDPPQPFFSPLCSFLADCQLVLLFICALALHHFGARSAPAELEKMCCSGLGVGWALAAVAEG